MASILRPFILLAKAIRAFFKADLRLRRGNRGLEVVLDETALKDKSRKVRPAAKAGPTLAAQQHELERMRLALKRLLDDVPEHRRTLRHLAYIEHGLEKKGLHALHKVPYDVLQRALLQFEGLVINWSDEALATLRSKMAVALIERERDPEVPAKQADEPESSLMDAAPLAHPEPLEGDDAAEAEAALLAAYGAVALESLDLGESSEAEGVEVQGELNSTSGKALAKAVRRSTELHEIPA